MIVVTVRHTHPAGLPCVIRWVKPRPRTWAGWRAVARDCRDAIQRYELAGIRTCTDSGG